MTRLRLFLLLLGLSCLPGQAAPSVPIMPPSEIRVGMHGYGRTVFHGTQVESFPVTILGVVRHFLQAEDLILFKIDSGYLQQKGLGIVAGMSGSPVYINGRLIGAVAYGWSFAKAPVGGITPITAMLQDMPGSPAMPATRSSGRQALDRPLQVAGETFHYVAMQGFHQSSADFSPDTLTLRPAASLLQTRGWSSHGLSRLQALLAGSDMMPVATMSLGAEPPTHALTRIVPGASIGVEMISGDLEVAATGTLTYLDGHRFLAFGHPLAQLGDIHIPVTEAYVFSIYPSAQSPFKLAGQLGSIGELSSDRSYAVGGTLGVQAPTVPVTIHISDPTRHLNRTVHLRVFDHPLLTSALISTAVSDALHSDVSSLGSTTAHLHYRIDTVSGSEPVNISTTQSSVNIEESVGADVGNVLEKVAINDFQSTHLRNVDLNVTLESGRRTAVIQRVFTDKSRYEPGETMVVGVEIKPFNQAAVVRTFKLPIPVDCDKGIVKLALCGGGELLAVRKKLSVTEPTPTSVSDVYRDLADAETNDQLVLTAQFPSSGAMVGSQRYTFLPTSMQELAAAVNSSAIMPEKDIDTQRQDLPWVVSGSQVMGIDVDVKTNTGYKPAMEGNSEAMQATERVGHPAPTTTTAPSPALIKSPVSLPEGGPDVKVLPSSTRRWLLSDPGFLQRGVTSSMRISEAGALSLGPGVSTENGRSEQVGWAVASGHGTTAIGYGPPGRVVIQRGGASTEEALPASAITALLVDGHGDVWAGTSRPGRVYRLTPGHAPQMVLETSAHYIWSLAVGSQGEVYAGTGQPGQIYRIQGDHGALWAETAESNVRSLAVSPDRTVYAGTGNRGVIYAGRDGHLRPFYSTDYGSVDGLAVVGDNLWAGSGKSIYRIGVQDGRVEMTDLHTGPILSMMPNGDHIYAGTLDGRLYDVGPAGAELVLDTRTGPLMALAGSSDGDILALHASPPGLSRLSGRAASQGSWESPILDAGATSQWGSVRWDQDLSGGGTVAVATRSGDTPRPDETWGAWTSTALSEGFAHVSSAPGRFLQLQVRMTAGAASPIVSGLTVYYRLTGREPHLSFSAPGTGDVWSGKHKITWKCDQGNRDELVFDVEASSDQGKSWKTIEMNHHPELKEHALTPDDKPAASPDDTVTWDTHDVADGVYRIRITARRLGTSDAVAFESAPVIVVNKRPSLEVSVAKAEDGKIRVEGTAKATLAAILEVSYRLEGGEWHLAQATDGMFDSPTERFWLEDSFDKKKPGFVELRATDEAGNVQILKKDL